MKDAAEMKFQNSDASGVRTNSVTEKKSYTSITCFNELVASDSYKLPVDNLLHLIEEIKIFGYLKQYGEASSEDLCSIGIKKPSSVISRLCKLGLPVVIDPSQLIKHAEAWLALLEITSGLTPIPEGVASLSRSRR